MRQRKQASNDSIAREKEKESWKKWDRLFFECRLLGTSKI